MLPATLEEKGCRTNRNNMPGRIETFYRRVRMLSLIPRHPATMTTSEIADRLGRQGFETDRRTVQRDLKELADSPLVALGCDDEDGREYRWFWPTEAPRTEFPTMSPATALSFLMVEQFMDKLLPPALHEQLQDYFDSARNVLRSEDPEHRAAAEWPDKVRVVPPGQPLLAPEIPPDILRGIYQAVLDNRRFRATYHPRSEDGKERDYVVNPLALVVRNHLIYLIATLWDYDDIKHLPLHRFRQVTLLDQSSRKPDDFDLDAHLYQSRAFDIPDPKGRKIKLISRFKKEAAYHLHETPLSDDQSIEPDGEGWVRLTATVLDTEQLWWWLNGFGDNVEIMEPTS
jgi:predicted DNA-binding transcriptional regulator YafY